MLAHAKSPHAVHVSDPATRAAIERRLLTRGVPRTHLDDETQNVLRELIEVRTQPATHEECIALARHIANQRAIDHIRRRARRGKHDVGPTDLADDYAGDDLLRRDPIDARRQMDVLKEQVGSGRISQRQLSIVEGVADGLDQAEIARKMKLSHQTVRNELSTARKTYRAVWSRMTGAVAALLLAVGLYKWLEPRQDVVTAPRMPAPGDNGWPEMGPKERAGEMRRKALHECDLGHWAECAQGLDQAKELDPEGDRDVRVQKAREEAQRALRGAQP